MRTALVKRVFHILFICTGIVILSGCTARPVLKSETIHITALGDWRFRVRVNMFFAGGFERTPGLFFPETEWYPLEKFRSWLGDTPLTVTYRTAPENRVFDLETGRATYPSIFHMALPDNPEAERIRVEYEFQAPYVDLSREELSRGRYIEYILVTGGTWNESIQDLTFSLETNDCPGITPLPDSYSGDCRGSTYFAHLTNAKLDRNFRLIQRDKSR